MSKFLDDFLLTMPSIQKDKILGILEEKENAGLIRSQSEYKRELERLLDTLGGKEGKPTLEPIIQEDRTNSVNYNKNLEDISFDLSSLFQASADIQRLLKDNHQLSKSLLADIKKKVYGIQAEVEKYSMLISNSDKFDDGIYEQFNMPQYTETTESKLSLLRTERFGDIRSNIYQAENIGNALQIAGVKSFDQLKTNYGRSLASIRVVNRTGKEASNKQHQIKNAIDGSTESFWAESIIVDDVITQNISDLWSHDYHDYPKNGAICEIEILLNGVSTVSELQYDPYSAYPLEVVSIYGYEASDSGSKAYELISPNHKSVYQRSQKSTDRMVFQFPSVEISKIRILIRQENYRKENFIVSSDQLTDSEMWDQISSSEEVIRDSKEPDETIAKFDKKNEVTGWTMYLRKLEEWAKAQGHDGIIESAKRAMEIIKVGDYKNPLLLALRAISPEAMMQENEEVEEELKKEWLATNKLSYLYGAYDISVYGREYRRNSIYVSKPLPLSSNPIKIALTTEEKHHDIILGPEEEISNSKGLSYNEARITDIEHYIAYKKNPNAADWLPLLPTNKKYVEGELLIGDSVGGSDYLFKDKDLIIYSFRFKFISKETVRIRKNGIPMSRDQYIISDDGYRIGILREHYSSSSVYTADYKPSDEAYLVDIGGKKGISPTQYIDENGETGEFFQEADMNKSITCKHLPYINREDVYSYNQGEGRYDEEKERSRMTQYPVIVRVDGEEFKNITNYATNSFDSDRLTENEGKTFAQIGKRIVFGAPNDGTPLENITVDYFYITTNIRLKSILRRNYSGYKSITPSLYSYQIKCQSYDQEV